MDAWLGPKKAAIVALLKVAHKGISKGLRLGGPGLKPQKPA
jgi:hypothetical protein